VEILYRHKVSEIDEQRKANKLLFVDTDCIVTKYYLDLQFKNTDINHHNKESQLALAIHSLNKYDLILFLEPDVPWIQDGTRTYGEEWIRENNNNKFKKMLDNIGVRYHSISGDYQERFIKSIELI